MRQTVRAEPKQGRLKRLEEGSSDTPHGVQPKRSSAARESRNTNVASASARVRSFNALPET